MAHVSVVKKEATEMVKCVHITLQHYADTLSQHILLAAKIFGSSSSSSIP